MPEYTITASHTVSAVPKQKDFIMHTHDTYEILIFLRGDASYTVEGSIYSLKSGDIMLMRKNEAHHLILRSEQLYERICINFDPRIITDADDLGCIRDLFEDRPLGQKNRIWGSLLRGSETVGYPEKIVNSENGTVRQSYLIAYLYELSHVVKENGITDDQSDGITSRVAGYINRHLFEELSLDWISEKFYISKSQLNRRFKHDMGTTVWNYILTKRLYSAREMIMSGGALTDIATSCGFSDYVSFYKAYKREFGHSPKCRDINMNMDLRIR